MINYKKCTDVNIEDIYQVFQQGFSDYIIKIEMSQDAFIKHFFGPEGNQLEYSFIAFCEEKPVGLILGGMKDYEGIKTLRCGTLCIHPDYRGQGIARQLFQRHKKLAIENKCKQLFLEVIKGNERAIEFYKKAGYEKVYDLHYYAFGKLESMKENSLSPFHIKEIEKQELKNVGAPMEDIHMNWQGDFDYTEKLHNMVYYGAYQVDRLIGVMSIQQGGKIYFLWVKPECRNKGAATALIGYAINDLKLEKLNISFSNNGRLGGFLRRLGFEKNSLSQYEMYLTL